MPQEMVDRQPQEHEEQTDNLSESSRSSVDEEQIDVFAGPSCSRDDQGQTNNGFESSGEMEPHQQTRYKYDNDIYMYYCLGPQISRGYLYFLCKCIFVNEDILKVM